MDPHTAAAALIHTGGRPRALLFLLYVLMTAEDWREAGDALAVMGEVLS